MGGAGVGVGEGLGAYAAEGAAVVVEEATGGGDEEEGKGGAVEVLDCVGGEGVSGLSFIGVGAREVPLLLRCSRSM